MRKVIIILPYFGGFPSYFGLWIESVRNNPSIDFLIFSDNDDYFDHNIPENIIFKHIEFGDFTSLIQKKFPFESALPNAYKLCDYKPAYGYIFSEEIKKYDFWGFCDCDLIFGNIRKFITDDILLNYDKIFVRGHLTLVRNNQRMNEFFMSKIDGCPYYKDVYTDNINRIFDEASGFTTMAKLGGVRTYDAICFDDICISMKQFISYQKWVSGTERRWLGSLYKYDLNGLFKIKLKDWHFHEEEVLYVHFQKRDMNMNLSLEQFKVGFFIVPNKFIEIPKRLSKLKFLYYARFRFIYLKYLKFRYTNMLKKIKSI